MKLAGTVVIRSLTCAALLCLIPGLVLAANTSNAVDQAAPTFYQDVLPILQESCQTCHRAGGDNIAGMVAPMSFMSYGEVRPWARSMARLVKSRQMPPWDATDHTAGVFSNERTITEAQIETIVAWAVGGARAGDVADAPPARSFPNTGGWLIGRPDLVVPLPEPYFVADDVEDVQPKFYIPITEEMMPEPRWVQAIQYMPDSDIVHHITGRASTPREEGEIESINEETFSLGSIAAGEDPTIYPPGFGNLLRAGLVLRISMHYHKDPGEGTAAWDRSSVGFKFHPKGTEVKHKVTWNTISNSGFEIPPGVDTWRVGSSRTFEKDTILLSLHPHMHFRGKSMIYTAFYPDGRQEILLDVPRYDYDWQTNFIYRQPKHLPPGTRIEVSALFDNSIERESEFPIDTSRAVSYGAPSNDEMMAPFLAWTYVEPEEVAPILAGAAGGQE